MAEVQTLARGLRIIEILAAHNEGMSSTELASLLDVDKGSMSRLMTTLVNYGFADRDEQTRRYFLGAYVQELGKRAGQYASLRDVAQPHLESLASDTHENAHIAVYSMPYALTIADIPSTEALRVVSEVGRRIPLHCSAVGKCLLAFAEAPLPTQMKRYTANTITSLEMLNRQLREIRHDKFALDDEELTIGVRGLAVPIRNREGRVIATMGISGPTVRLTDEAIPDLVRMLKQYALAVSAELGFQK